MSGIDRSPADHALVDKAKEIPIGVPSQPVLSVAPITLSTPSRPVDLQLRVSFPLQGSSLPIVLLSHGHGRSNNLSSLHGYGPAADFLASRGFVVIQPTHLSSKFLGLEANIPGDPYFRKSRVEDMKTILDQMNEIENLVPGLEGRLDPSRVAVVGHSMGGQTASSLLGLTGTDPIDGTEVYQKEPRIKAGVLLGAPGRSEHVSDFARENHSFFCHADFSTMDTPALVVAADDDANPKLNTAGSQWHMDPYTLSTGPKSLFTVYGGGHCFSGISGYDALETGSHEDPDRLAAVLRVMWAYLRSEFYPGDDAWQRACDALKRVKTIGEIASK